MCTCKTIKNDFLTLDYASGYNSVHEGYMRGKMSIVCQNVCDTFLISRCVNQSMTLLMNKLSTYLNRKRRKVSHTFLDTVLNFHHIFPLSNRMFKHGYGLSGKMQFVFEASQNGCFSATSIHFFSISNEPGT